MSQRMIALAADLSVRRIVAASWLIALAALGALQLTHAGLHERHELPALMHWLRDSALAVPIAAVSTVGAAVVARGATPGVSAPLRAAVAWAVLGAALFGLLGLAGHEAHADLFGADREPGGLMAALDDGLLTFQVAVGVLLPAALLTGGPWRTRAATVVPRPTASTPAVAQSVVTR